jgi:UDP-N-acetylglucosamine acyltransferase
LGAGVRLVSHVVISGHTEIGARTIVSAGAVLGGPAQIRGNNAPDARLSIGEDCVIRESVTMNLGSARDKGITRVGARGYFMAYSHVGHDCRLGNGITLSNGVQLAGHVELGDGVIMGGLAAAQQFSRIGKYAFVSGLSGVSLDVIPYGMAIGLHARHGGLNLIGLRRRNIPRPRIHALRAAFRSIFEEQQGALHDRARRAAETWPDMPEVQDVTTFILADAKRSIAPARLRGGDEAEPDE